MPWYPPGFYTDADFRHHRKIKIQDGLPAGSVLPDLLRASVCVEQVDVVQVNNDISAPFAYAGLAAIDRWAINYILLNRTATVGAGTVALEFSITDVIGARTISSAAIPLTVAGSTQGVIPIFGTIQEFATVHTGIYSTAQYDVHIWIDKVASIT